MLPERIRTASETDLDQVTNTLWLAFQSDPLWSWVFPERDKLKPWWRFLIRSALQHGWVLILDDYAAVSVWIPPGCDELSREEEQRVKGLLEDLVGSRAEQVMELLERFEACHPREDHYYLSLLGTHPDHRGRGLGMGLLAEGLSRIDAQGMPAYLESSNPANDERYESLGFKRVGAFSTPDNRHTASTMWREPAPQPHAKRLGPMACREGLGPA